jgi:hypothetical protein
MLNFTGLKIHDIVTTLLEKAYYQLTLPLS